MLNRWRDGQKAALFIGIIGLLMALVLVLPIRANTNLMMYLPLTAVLIAMLLTGEAFAKAGWRQLGFYRFPGKMSLVAFVVPALPILAGHLIVWWSGLGRFGLIEPLQGRETELLLSFVLSFILSSLTVTLGEEAGWRGYLAEKLKGLGWSKSLLANGFIWSLFHLPVIVFTDIYHNGVFLWTFIPMFIVTVTLAGTFMTYLRYATGSIWPPIIAHSSHNAFWNVGMWYTQDAAPSATYIVGDVGAVQSLFYLVLFIWIVRKHKNSPLL
ncbi:CPBP family intramembrane metalloprotease [Paenibacillus sp. TRM 82003]|nr:CPBP family intramembrane metalloprotease [Paenibacillus sp. TRM 82003]